MVRKLAGALLVAGALTSQYAGALGLGELKLNSALNQPLNAEIKLVNVGDLTKDQVIVKLASQLAFEQAGVERDYFLTNLKFTVHLDGRGSGVIKIKTQNLVREPYLDFLIEARWPTGKVLREYTALVDLPVFSEKTQTSVNLGSAQVEPTPNPVTRQPAPQQQTTYLPPASKQRYQPAQEVNGSSTRYTSSGGGSYEIRKRDTLWNIARDARPSDDVSVHQTMMAIQQINPGAFINNNINLLKSGHVLRLPTEDEVRDINNRRAIQQVAVQNKKWREKESVSGAQLDATGKKSTSKYAEVEGQLRLTNAEKADGKGVGGSSAGDSRSNSAAGGDNQALLEANEEKAALELENQELTGRMSDLEEQVQKLQRLVELKNNELARLQGNLAKSNEQKVEGLIDRTQDKAGELADGVTSSVDGMKDKASGAADKIEGAIEGGLDKVDGKIDEALGSDTAGSVKDQLDKAADGLDDADGLNVDGVDVDPSQLADTDKIEGEIESAVDGAIDSAQEAGANVAEKLEDGASSALDAGKDALSGSDSTEPSFIDKLLEKPMYLGGALLALLAGLFALLFRKKGKKEEDTDETVFDSVDGASEEVGSEFDFPEPEADSLVQDQNQELDLDNAFDELSGDVSDAEHSDLTDTNESLRSTHPETGDAIGEADIYVAYGRYDQAADLLNSALEQDSSRSDVRLKLLEVHLESQNKEGFKEQYQQIAALGDDDLKGKAKELLTNVEGAADWIDIDATGVGSDSLGLGTLAGAGGAAVAGAGALASGLMGDDSDDKSLDEAGLDDKTIVQGVDELDLDNFSLDTVEDESLDAIDQLDLETTDETSGFEFDAKLDLDDNLTDESVPSNESLNEDFDKTLQNLDLPESDLNIDLGAGELSDDLSEVTSGAEFELPDASDLSETADGIDLNVTLDREVEAFDLSKDSGIDLDETVDRAAETLGTSENEAGLDAGDLGIAGAGAATSAAALMALSEQGQSEADLTDDEDDDLNFLTQSDQVATKLDLARAYIDMGDIDGAREILQEVVEEGEEGQKDEAQGLLDQL